MSERLTAPDWNYTRSSKPQRPSSALNPVLIGFGVLLFAIGVGFGGYWYWTNHSQNASSASSPNPANTAKPTAPVAPDTQPSPTVAANASATSAATLAVTQPQSAPSSANGVQPDALITNSTANAAPVDEQNQLDAAYAARENDLAVAKAAREEAERDRAALAQAQYAREQSQQTQLAQTQASQDIQTQPRTQDNAAQMPSDQGQAQDSMSQPDAQPSSTLEAEYNRRAHSECANGFFGKSCRHNIRESLCSGRTLNAADTSFCHR